MTEPTSSETRSVGDSLFVSEADSLKPLQTLKQVVEPQANSIVDDFIRREIRDQYARAIQAAVESWKTPDPAILARIEAKLDQLTATLAEALKPSPEPVEIEQRAEISIDPVTGEPYLSAFTSSDMTPDAPLPLNPPGFELNLPDTSHIKEPQTRSSGLTPEQQVCRHTYTRTGTRCENCGGGIREIEMFRRYRQ